MKVKILRNFDYSLDGIKPTSFKEGETTEKFNESQIKSLMERGWVGVKGSKTVSQTGANPSEKEKAEKEKAQKFEKRKAEIIKAGATYEKGVFSYLDESFPEKDLLAPNDQEWDAFLENLIELIAESGPEESDDEELDDSFDDSDEDLGSEPEKDTGKNKKSSKKSK